MLSLACIFRDTDWINIVISDNNINTFTSNFNNFVTDNIKQYISIKTSRIRKKLPKYIYRLRYKTKLTFSKRNTNPIT